MVKIGINKSGIALFIILATIFIVLLLGDITLKFIAGQNRFSHERVNRIQAYYAAKAGMNYALEMLRVGTWTFTPNTCSDPTGCSVTDSNFPSSITSVKVIFCPSGSSCSGTASSCQPPTGINFCVNTIVTYQ